ncbi:hypothetical protein [Idiomarina abyssalis]|uniref:hypothetical protein n=1 Tax=Idiomarina abyssalis TaxID=86102 RepID=UPI003A920B84
MSDTNKLPYTEYSESDLIGQSVYCEKSDGHSVQGRITKITWVHADNLFPVFHVEDDTGTTTSVLHDEITRL